MLRTALAACAAAMFVAAPSFAEAPAASACAETNFRIYFSHGSAALDPESAQMLDIASRSVAECPYAELRVAVDAASPQSLARANAIRAAAHERNWDAVRVVRLRTPQYASQGGPEYAEVVMSPNANAVPDEAPMVTANIGI